MFLQVLVTMQDLPFSFLFKNSNTDGVGESAKGRPIPVLYNCRAQ